MEDDLIPPYDSYADAYDHFAEYEYLEQYCQFEAAMEELKHDVYNLLHFGDENGPDAYAAELLAEAELMKEAEEREDEEWHDHLNPVQAFEKQKMWELEFLGSYPDSYDRYEWYALRDQEIADEFGPEPQNEDECKL